MTNVAHFDPTLEDVFDTCFYTSFTDLLLQVFGLGGNQAFMEITAVSLPLGPLRGGRVAREVGFRSKFSAQIMLQFVDEETSVLFGLL